MTKSQLARSPYRMYVEFLRHLCKDDPVPDVLLLYNKHVAAEE